jgi:hypothetical protein
MGMFPQWLKAKAHDAYSQVPNIAVAVCATIFTLQRVVTGRENPFALLFAVVLIIMITWPQPFDEAEDIF